MMQGEVASFIRITNMAGKKSLQDMQAFVPENFSLFERYYIYLKILPCFVFDDSESYWILVLN